MSEKALRLTFEDSSKAGKTVVLRVNKCNEAVNGSVVRAAMQAIYDNRAIFVPSIGAIKKADFITPMILTPVNIG